MVVIPLWGELGAHRQLTPAGKGAASGWGEHWFRACSPLQLQVGMLLQKSWWQRKLPSPPRGQWKHQLFSAEGVDPALRQ